MTPRTTTKPAVRTILKTRATKSVARKTRPRGSKLVRKTVSAMAAQGGGVSVGRANVDRQQAAQEHNTNREECPRAETSGTVVAMRHVPGFRIIENHYPAGLELPRHFHNHAYLSYVLEGP